MALVLRYEVARTLYELAFRRKKDPSQLLSELITEAAVEQERRVERPVERRGKSEGGAQTEGVQQ